MTNFHTLGDTPARKCVLIVNPDTPGIANLRWQQLAKHMIPQEETTPRTAHHAAEYREVPPGLFMALYNALTFEHGLAVAISCIHQTPDEQILVCTGSFFDRTVFLYLREIRSNAIALEAELNHLLEMTPTLEILAASGDFHDDLAEAA